MKWKNCVELSTHARSPDTLVHGVRRLADLVYPPTCMGCQVQLPTVETRFCPTCEDAIDQERRRPACPRCASTVAPFELANDQCRSCRQRPTRTRGMVRVGYYEGVLAELIRAYKYHGHESIEPILATWLADAVRTAPWLDEVEAIVSVPTHWRHRIARPLYAAEALAAGVARHTGVPEARVLRRVRGGRHQIGLPYTERQENVRGAFAMRSGVTLRKARLLLIDDVKTTGATIEECAKVLRRAGAAKVYAAVVVTAGWTHAAGYAIRSALAKVGDARTAPVGGSSP